MDTDNALVTFKIHLLSSKGEVRESRRFSLARSSLDITSLYAALGTVNVVLAYRDTDGDQVSLRTQPDVDEMMRVVPPGIIHLTGSVTSVSNMRLACDQARPHLRSAQRAVATAATNVAHESKKVAEEALVLGARGVSYASDSSRSAVATVSDVAATVAKESKKVAEEAIVLGVRGVSYASNQWTRLSSEAKPEQQPQPQPPSTTDASWVKVESSSPPTEPEPPVSYAMQKRLDELAAMGFTDRDRNLVLLRESNLDLAVCISRLLEGA